MFDVIRDGTITLRGTLVRGDMHLSQSPSGTLRFIGDVARTKQRVRATAGTLNFGSHLGVVVTKIPKPKVLAGTVRLSGGLTYSNTEVKAVAGTLRLSGAFTGVVNRKSTQGTITFSGSQAREIKKILGGTVQMFGGIEPFQFNEGTVTFSGVLESETSRLRAQAGTVTFRGDLDIPGKCAGTVTFTGTLSNRVGIDATGQLNFSGNLRMPEFVDDLGGRLSFMRVLSIVYTPYSYGDVSTMNMAAGYDLEIEQGATFTRKFRWLKDDGTPFDLTNFSIFMSIRPTKSSPELILSTSGSSGITITKSTTEMGVFTATITSSVTAELSFTRAVYDIIVRWGLGSSTRLLEGEVILSRGVTSGVVYRETKAGTVTFNGSLAQPVILKGPSGTIYFSGAYTTEIDRFRSTTGTLALGGSLSKELRIASANGSGSLMFSGACIPVPNARTAGTVTMSGGLTTSRGHVTGGTVTMHGNR